VTLHGSLSPSEISSCLWVGNQWQMQSLSQQLTVVNEHNKAPQILSKLYLLLFYCLIILLSLSQMSLVTLLYGLSVTEKNLFLYCLISLLSFPGTNIIFLNSSN
jgi:hypothetical protein